MTRARKSPGLSSSFPLTALALLSLACASGVSHIELEDPGAGTSAAPVTASVVLAGVHDRRQAPERVGAKKNTSGRVVGDAVLSGSATLETVVTEHLTALLERSGYRWLAPDEAGAEQAPQLELGRCWAEFGPGAFARGAQARVEFVVLATRGPAEPTWTRVLSARAEASSLGGAEALLSSTLNEAYADVMGQLAVELQEGTLGAYLHGAAP